MQPFLNMSHFTECRRPVQLRRLRAPGLDPRLSRVRVGQELRPQRQGSLQNVQGIHPQRERDRSLSRNFIHTHKCTFSS